MYFSKSVVAQIRYFRSTSLVRLVHQQLSYRSKFDTCIHHEHPKSEIEGSNSTGLRHFNLFTEDAALCSVVNFLVVLASGEVVLGLDQSVPPSRSLDPRASLVGSPLQVELGEVKELERFGQVLLVVLFLLGSIPLSDFLVFGFGQAGGNVSVAAKRCRRKLRTRLQRLGISLVRQFCTYGNQDDYVAEKVAYLLLGTSAVFVLVLDRSPEVHVSDLKYNMKRNER